MRPIVHKYGGTSVADLDRIGKVADRVLREHSAERPVAVVVSAMAGETNRLLALAHAVHDDPADSEVDVLLATGEQQTAALLALALHERGARARSFLGHQVRLLCDGRFGRARITGVDAAPIRACLEQGSIAVVAGFQGVDEDGRVNTLGRGGSDTTAVAVAAALEAEACEIYTDVEGVFTTDPRVCPEARRVEAITYEEMLEMASLGAKVLDSRSVEYAMRAGVEVRVRSSFSDGPGTRVGPEEDVMEDRVATAVAFRRDEAKVALRGVPDRPGVAGAIFSKVRDSGVVVDMIVQNVSAEGATDLTFTVPRGDLKRVLPVVEAFAEEIGAGAVETDDSIAKVSLIGVGMRSHAGVAALMFEALAGVGVNIQMISTSEIKISCIIDEKFTELAVRVLHEAFALDREPEEEPPSGESR